MSDKINQVIEESSYINPVFVISSTGRTGTTLLQRLICSANNGICYGEKTLMDLLVRINQVANFENQIKDESEHFDAILNNILEGKVNVWIPELFPQIDEYIIFQLKSAYSMANSVQEYSHYINKPVWAAKNPRINIDLLAIMLKYLPGCKVIYLYRDIINVAKSYKARKFIKNKEELLQLCKTWSLSLNQLDLLMGEGDPRVWVLNYDNMVKDTNIFIDKLESFTGLKEVNKEVLSFKINTFLGNTSDGLSPSGYIKPEELDEEEMKIIMMLCDKELVKYCNK